MDSPFLLVSAGMIVAVVVASFLLPGWIRRRTQRSGERSERTAAEAHTAAALDELAKTLSIDAPLATARELVEQVIVQHPRMFTVLGDDHFGIRFVHADDAVARLAPAAGGALLSVTRSREHLGAPKGAGFWTELLAHVSTAASSRGIRTSEGPAVRFERHPADPSLWVGAGSGRIPPAEDEV
ncbi:hypothetical protein [Microbacterium sp.]|uniref:hypothetical protein n=1 Tax=Microbacterium sp. TaxID=51671 RepID=UPI0039E582A6